MAALDYQVGASANDGMLFNDTLYTELVYFGCYTGLNMPMSVFLRFTGITIPVGATISAAYLSFRSGGLMASGNVATTIYANDTSAPAAPTSPATFNAKVKTTASVGWTFSTFTSGTWYNTPSLTSIVQELVNSYSYASGDAMQFLVIGSASGNGAISYDYSENSSYAAKLHIEYEAAGDPEGSLLGGKLIRGGLLLHGVLRR